MDRDTVTNFVDKLLEGDTLNGKPIKLEVKLKMIEGLVAASCPFCGSVTLDSIGLFHPDKAEEFGGIPGKHRFILYAICSTCASDKNADMIEEMCLKKFGQSKIH